MAYAAIVTRLTNVRPHPNADRLQLADVLGVQLVVGLDAKENDLGIFFPEDGRVSTNFCEYNDLYPRFNEDGSRAGGFFDRKHNRVRSQKFRGEKSTGYFADIESVAYTGVDLTTLVEGSQFDELNGQMVCEKYYSQKALNALKGGTPKTRKENIMFPKHVDSLRFQYVKDDIVREGSRIYITEKLHGTSQRVAYVLEDVQTKKARWYNKLFSGIGKEQREKVWQVLIGSRNVTISDPLTQGFYGNDSFRFKVAEQWQDNLQKGEVVFGEIVGWVSEETPIMARQTIKDDKVLKKAYGSEMTYSYGNPVGQCTFYVYRIIKIDEDGESVELSWPQVKRRCTQLGLKHVPELGDYGIVSSSVDIHREMLSIGVNAFIEGPSTLDPTHIREGVVLRVEHADGTVDFVKSKSFTFGVLEGYIKDDEDYVDPEEVS